MESSKIFGGTEECNSCESGWTMYIGSPTNGSDDDGGHSHGEDHSNDRGYDDDDDGDDMNYNHEDYSDDSMASDASSGPSNQGISHFRTGEDRKTESKCNSEKKVRKPMDKQNAESRRKNDKETKEFMAERSTNTAAKTGSKVRRNNWIGKRK